MALWYEGVSEADAVAKYLRAIQLQVGAPQTGTWDCSTRRMLLAFVNDRRAANGENLLTIDRAAWLVTELLEDYGKEVASGQAVTSFFPAFLEAIGLPSNQDRAIAWREAHVGDPVFTRAIEGAMVAVDTRVRSLDSTLVCSGAGGGSGSSSTPLLVGGVVIGALVLWALLSD